MNVYLASPGSQLHAHLVCGQPVLMSFGAYRPWMERYQHTYRRLLIDSGAFGELGGKRVDIEEYKGWSERYIDHAEAIAGLDDISGDWRRSLANYQRIAWGFPTFHDTDPPELLEELIAIARETPRKRWIGIGLKPPRDGKERFVRQTCERIPDDLHVHGWALRAYTRIRRLDTVDSTNWMLDGMALVKELPWLTYAECLEIVVKRYERWDRRIVDVTDSRQMELIA